MATHLLNKSSMSYLKYAVSSSLRYLNCPTIYFQRDVASQNSDRLFQFSDLQIQVASKAQKKAKPDEDKLAFGQEYSDHMFEVEWTSTSGWGTPRILPLHSFILHPGSKVFHYAQAVFEGMKAFKRSDGKVALFRPDLNMRRMLSSAKRAALPSFDGDELLKCTKKLIYLDKEWIPGKKDSSLYIRPTFIGTQDSLGVMASSRALLYIITCPVGPYFSSGVSQAVSLLADPRFVRAWPGGTGDRKMASNYGASLYVQKLAQEQGLQQVLWLFGEDHQIAEAGAMNVFFFLNKGTSEQELVTPALDGTILPGVVRQSILDLARQWNEFNVSERVITMEELIHASKEKKLLEMFVCGTACSVCPVKIVKYQNETINIPTMEVVDPVYQRFYKAITDIQYGRIESDWSVPVGD